MLKRIPEIFIQPFPHWEKIEFFRKLFYAFLLINAISLLPIAHEIFGYDGIVGAGGWNTKYPWYAQGSKALVNVLSHPLHGSNPWITYVFVYGQILFLITGLINVLPKLSSLLVYFFTVNLFLKGYLMFTGGEALVNILLFYLIFIQRSDRKSEKRSEPYFSPLQNLLNNTFYWVVLIQVCVLYFLSALYKLTDEYWVGGEAMMYVSRVDSFSGDTIRFIFADSPILSIIATYLALLYQGLFPILVWVKRIKGPFLLFGVLFHLGISFGMGIFTFGIIMIITYVLFLDIKQIRSLKKWIGTKFRIRQAENA